MRLDPNELAPLRHLMPIRAARGLDRRLRCDRARGDADESATPEPSATPGFTTPEPSPRRRLRPPVGERAVRGGAAPVFVRRCAGYHIGPVQPYYLRHSHHRSADIQKRHLLPARRAVTDSVIKQFQRTAPIASVMTRPTRSWWGKFAAITRAPVRSVRGNVLATVEFGLTLRVRYELVDRKTRKNISSPAEVSGTTSFFVGPDITTDERQAIPLAAEHVATRLVSQLSEGW